MFSSIKNIYWKLKEFDTTAEKAQNTVTELQSRTYTTLPRPHRPP